MAKFSGKNIEFKDFHKVIFGDDDDSALYWDGVNEDLRLTTVISGVDPFEPGHLVTLGYFEHAIDPTASGSIGNILFGSEYSFTTNEAESSTNSTTYQNKMSFTVNDVPAGEYRIGWHFEWRTSKTNQQFEYRVQQDDTTTLDTRAKSPFVDVNEWQGVTNFYYIEALASGTHYFDLDYRSSDLSSTAYIRAARFEFWRVI